MRKTKVINGKLSVYFETGYEGSNWVFIEDGKSGYDALHILKKGDLLSVFNDNSKKKTIFNAEVDFKMVKKPPFYLEKPIQKNISRRKWRDMFLKGKPAQLTVKK